VFIASAPAAPVATNNSRCGAGTVNLSASATSQINWYDVLVGGNVLDTGMYFTTPSINATTTYYVDAGIGCNSSRVPVVATILASPPPPTAIDVTRCGAGTVSLTASSSQQIYWFDAPTGGNQLAIGTTYNTPSLNATTTYYVETGDNCHSARIPVQAIIGGTQVSNVVDGAICGSGTVVLSVSSAQGVDSIVWYNAPGGTQLGTGNYFSTPFISSTTPYYVVAYSSCTGLPVAVNAVVYPVPAINLGPDTIIVPSGQTYTLDAGPGFSTYRWSNNATSSSILVNSNGWYSVEVTDANGCPNSDRVYIYFTLTGISSIDGKNSLEVYPNPTHDKLIVTLPESSSKYYTLKLLSIEGKILMQEDVKNAFTKEQSKLIHLNNFAAGVYILELLSNDYSATVKVFVE
jgi:hypothetical protein